MASFGNKLIVSGLVALSLSACTDRAETSNQSVVASVPAAPPTAAADVSISKLPDTNYATKELLEVRKNGLAKTSAEGADPTKTGSIDPIAIDPYTRADYPDVVRQWGALIPTINKERKLAAQIAAKDPRCDGVTNAQLTDGGTRTNRHYMTECNNITRIYFDAKSLAEHRSALVRTQADMGAQGILDW
jgi:hypothetical protein